MGRPSLLDADRLRAIRRAARLGLSQEDAARAVGVSPRSWANWLARARRIEEVLGDRGADGLTVQELQDLAREIGVELAKLSGSGARGRAVKRDLVLAVTEQAAPYVQFLQELQAAEPHAELALLDRLDRIGEGGLVVVEVDVQGNVTRRGVRKKKTITEYRRREIKDSKGEVVGEAWVPGRMVEVVEERELPSSRMAVQKMLEIRWPERYGHRKAIDPADQQEPERVARRVVDSARAMFGTVPPPLELPAAPVDADPEDGG